MTVLHLHLHPAWGKTGLGSGWGMNGAVSSLPGPGMVEVEKECDIVGSPQPWLQADHSCSLFSCRSTCCPRIIIPMEGKAISFSSSRAAWKCVLLQGFSPKWFILQLFCCCCYSCINDLVILSGLLKAIFWSPYTNACHL